MRYMNFSGGLCFAGLILVLLACLAGPADAETSRTVIDNGGQAVTVARPFTRIISLYSAHTENLVSLGAAGQLIGIDGGEGLPPAAAGIAKFSYREDPEKFLAAAPDLVLVRPMIERSAPEFVGKLRRAGVTVVSLQPNTVEDMFAYWRSLALLTGREPQAEEMIKGFTARLTRVQNSLKTVEPARRPKVYFESIHGKMKTFAPESIGIYVLEQAGGINLAADAEQVRETNIAAYGKERLLSRGEEIDIYLAQRGRMNPVDLDTIRKEPGFQAIKAVREDKIHLIDEALVSRPTLRILDGIEQLNRLFFPPQDKG